MPTAGFSSPPPTVESSDNSRVMEIGDSKDKTGDWGGRHIGDDFVEWGTEFFATLELIGETHKVPITTPIILPDRPKRVSFFLSFYYVLNNHISMFFFLHKERCMHHLLLTSEPAHSIPYSQPKKR